MNKKNTEKDKLKILLVGCPLGSGNGGVTALGYSAIANIIRCHSNIDIYIQHNVEKKNQDEIMLVIEGKDVVVRPVFYHTSSRFREWQGLRFLGLLAPLVSKIPRFLRAKLIRRLRLFKALMAVDAVLDVSGGDSFTSIYGDDVFDGIATIKKIAICFKVPLYLLPQSYGPFVSQKHTNSAGFIFEKARLIGSRDAHGRSLITTLAPIVSPSQIIESPDIAFSMEVDSTQGKELQRKSKGNKLIGLNVSGLLYFNHKEFGLNFDYKNMIHQIVEWVIHSTEANLVLVPHVVNTVRMSQLSGGESSDTNAIEVLCERYKDWVGSRIFIAEEYIDPREVKGVIAKCDFFMGARMHACIAAISQAIPTLCHAYSDKFIGVMSMIGMESSVVDMRSTTIDSILTQLAQGLSNLDEYNQQDVLDDMDKHKKRIESFFDVAIKDIIKLKQA